MATFFSRGRPGSRTRPNPHYQRAEKRRHRPGQAARWATAALLVLAVLLSAPVAAWAADSTPTPAPASTPSATPSGAGDATPDAQPGPSPAPPSGTTPTPTTGTSTPGTPAPSTPTPATPSAPTAPTIPGDGGSGGIAGWITNAITNAITSFFKDLVLDGLNPLLDLLGRTLLTTPEPSDLPAIGELWSTSWTITVAAYGLLIMAGGIIALSYQTTQTSTSIKEILPRIPIGFLAAGFSQLLAAKAIELTNPLPAAILGGGVDPNTASAQLRNIVIGALNVDSANRDVFTIFLGVFLALAVAALMCVYIGRVTLTVCLIGSGPVF